VMKSPWLNRVVITMPETEFDPAAYRQDRVDPNVLR
jgi:hypothetical protein